MFGDHSTLFIVQAQDNIMNLPLANGWGEKHRLYVKWKYVEAKVYICYSRLIICILPFLGELEACSLKWI